MKDIFRHKSSALLSKRSMLSTYINNDKFDNVDLEEDYYTVKVSSATIIMKHYNDKKLGGSRMFQSKFNLIAIKG